MDERIYSKNIIEFVTVSAEYCAFIERVPELEKEEFLDKIIKILPLLYLKATLLTPEEPEEDGFSEKFVTENMYESVRENIESLLEYKGYTCNASKTCFQRCGCRTVLLPQILLLSSN